MSLYSISIRVTSPKGSYLAQEFVESETASFKSILACSGSLLRAAIGAPTHLGIATNLSQIIVRLATQDEVDDVTARRRPKTVDGWHQWISQGTEKELS